MDDIKNDMDPQKTNMDLSFEQRFGWYVVLNRVSENSLKEHDKIVEKNVVEVLNQLLYLIEYDKEQIRLQKKAQAQG
jgi:hypothetical protein